MKTNIIEGNKLIAEFMGLAYCERYQYIGWYKNSEFNHRICDFDGLKYHSDWNWIMPVVIQINTMDDFRYSVKILTMDVDIEDSHTSTIVAESSLDYNPSELLDSVYVCVVRFIKWYNKNK